GAGLADLRNDPAWSGPARQPAVFGGPRKSWLRFVGVGLDRPHGGGRGDAGRELAGGVVDLCGPRAAPASAGGSAGGCPARLPAGSEGDRGRSGAKDNAAVAARSLSG